MTTSHIRSISNTNARGTEYAELTVSALECCDHFGEPRIQEAIRAWRAEQPDNRTHHLHSAAATATAAPNTVTPVRAHPARGADDDDDDSLGARPEGARAEAASPLAAPLRKRARTPAASPDGSDSNRPVPHSGAQRPRTALSGPCVGVPADTVAADPSCRRRDCGSQRTPGGAGGRRWRQ